MRGLLRSRYNKLGMEHKEIKTLVMLLFHYLPLLLSLPPPPPPPLHYYSLINMTVPLFQTLTVTFPSPRVIIKECMITHLLFSLLMNLIH